MSYSFSVRGKSKAEALAAVTARFDEVVQQQPVHTHDRPTAQEQVEKVLALVNEPAANEEISVSVNGYVSWRGEGQFTGVSVNVSATVITP